MKYLVGNPSFRPRAEVARGKKTSPILQSKRKSRAQSPPPTSIIIQVLPRFMHIPSFSNSADRRRSLGGRRGVKMLRTLGRRSVEENVGPAGLASEVDIRGRRRRVREFPKYLYTYRTITSHTIGELWISATTKIIVQHCVRRKRGNDKRRRRRGRNPPSSSSSSSAPPPPSSNSKRAETELRLLNRKIVSPCQTRKHLVDKPAALTLIKQEKFKRIRRYRTYPPERMCITGFCRPKQK